MTTAAAADTTAIETARQGVSRRPTKVAKTRWPPFVDGGEMRLSCRTYCWMQLNVEQHNGDLRRSISDETKVHDS